MRAFWSACIQLGYPYGDYYRLLLLTGTRRSSQCSAVAGQRPRERLGSSSRRSASRATAHTSCRSSMAKEIVAGLPKFAKGEHLFSFTFGRTPINSHSEHKAKLDDLMKKELQGLAFRPWKVHDIRRMHGAHQHGQARRRQGSRQDGHRTWSR